MSNIFIIAGSPSENSKTEALLTNIGEQLAAQSHTLEYSSVLKVPAEDLAKGNYKSPAVKIIAEQIEAADVVIIGTPIYKASFTGVLKSLLDLLPQEALTDKTILPIATGGSQSHYLALDYSFTPVLHALGATHVLKPIFILDAHLERIKNKVQVNDKASSERITHAIKEIDHAAIKVGVYHE